MQNKPFKIISVLLASLFMGTSSWGLDCSKNFDNLNEYRQRAIGAYQCVEDVHWPDFITEKINKKIKEDKNLKSSKKYLQDLVLLRMLILSLSKNEDHGSLEGADFFSQKELMKILWYVNEFQLKHSDLIQINANLSQMGLDELKKNYGFSDDWLELLHFDMKNLKRISADFNNIIEVERLKQIEENAALQKRICFWVFGDNFEDTLKRINPQADLNSEMEERSKFINIKSNANFVIAQCALTK